jgi:hypothetical protein
MGQIHGERPREFRRNFHGTKGEHLFPHPETYARKSEWTSWDRAYAAHLDRHRELIDNPEPMPGDSEAVRALFDHIEHLTETIAKEKQLIIALRQRDAQGAEGDDKDLTEVLAHARAARRRA